MTHKVLILTFATLSLGAVALFAAEATQAPDTLADEKAQIEAEKASSQVEYVFRNKSRISPFKMQLRGGGNIPDSVDTQKLSREEQEALVVQCEKLSVRLISWAMRKQIDEVMEASSHIAEFRTQVTDEDLIGKLEKIQQRVDAALIGVMELKVAMLWQTASSALEQMKASFANKKYGAVLSLYNTIAMKLNDFKSTPGDPMSDKIVKLAVEMQKLSLRASIRAEFLRRRPNVSGVFIVGDKRSAIIDGTMVEEGERIGQILIVKVEAGPKITFLYRGEQVVVEYDQNKLMSSK